MSLLPKAAASTDTLPAYTTSPAYTPAPTPTYTPAPPAPAPPAPISPAEEKAALASRMAGSVHEPALGPPHTALDPRAVCAAYGHDARPSFATAMALGATVPFSVAYLAARRTVACNRCGVAVRRSPCPWQSWRSGPGSGVGVEALER
ncbi:hypothetical protein Q8F55_002873 [Vanrija albida]|uniref:LITAF domain-containing protein n=1 Tax=Vanrija albida TaxID=181172 RepID=A0ABR3QB67_9TREE